METFMMFGLFFLGILIGWAYTGIYYLDGKSPFWTGFADTFTLRILWTRRK